MRVFYAAFAVLVFTCSFAFFTEAQGKDNSSWDAQKEKRLKSVPPEAQALILAAIPERPSVTPKSERKILVFWRCEGFIHSSIPHGNFMIEKMGASSGTFSCDFADDYSVFSAEDLAKYDAILLNNTTDLRLNDEQKAAILEFVRAGGGMIGLHAASDNFKNWPEGADMIGGLFDGHPWTAGGKWAFQVEDPSHPINAAFQGKGFWHSDEIYQNAPQPYSREKVRVLVSLDMSKPQNTQSKFRKMLQERQIKRSDKDFAVSWIREFGKGRVFYSNFGHREDTYQNPTIVRHFLDGILFAIGDLTADATPSSALGDQKVIAQAPNEN